MWPGGHEPGFNRNPPPVTEISLHPLLTALFTRLRFAFGPNGMHRVWKDTCHQYLRDLTAPYIHRRACVQVWVWPRGHEPGFNRNSQPVPEGSHCTLCSLPCSLDSGLRVAPEGIKMA
jgi:hypothetical protein